MDNQARLMDYALELFAARGYDAVGVQDIVDAAGVTKPTLYHYFGSKRGLLDALLAANFGPLVEQAEQAAAYDHDLVLTLEKTARVYFEFARGNPTFYRLHLTMYFASPAGEPNQAVMDYQLRLYHMLEDLFSAAAADHGNMLGRHKLFAATFMGMVNTYIGLFLNGNIELDDRLVFQAVHQFMHGIFS
jgi:TetR/AcrR family transcriptional regulator